jgi:hypothetical protein
MKALRRRRGIAHLFLNLGARWGWVVNATPWLFYSRERDPIPIPQDAWWALQPVWISAENLVPAGIRSLDLPARSELLDRLSSSGRGAAKHVGGITKLCLCVCCMWKGWFCRKEVGYNLITRDK